MLVKLRRRFVLITMVLIGVVLAVMLAVSVVSSYQSRYAQIQESLSAALGMDENGSLRPWIGDGPGDFRGGPTDGAPSNDTRAYNMQPVYVVSIESATGAMTYANNTAQMDEQVLKTAVERVLSSNTYRSGGSSTGNTGSGSSSAGNTGSGSSSAGNVNTGTHASTSDPTGSAVGSSGLFLDLGLCYASAGRVDGGVTLTLIAFADCTQLVTSTIQQAIVSLLIWAVAMLVLFAISLYLSKLALRPVEQAWAQQQRFVANASHELKTPLTVILANNNLMLAHPEKPTSEQAQWLESTQEEASRMDMMLRDLLLLAQLDEGARAQNVPAHVDLSALVEHALLQFDAVFFERQIPLKSHLEPAVTVVGIAEHLTRLVTILLDNASKYSIQGGTVTVTLRRSTRSKSAAILEVSNESEQIPPKQLQRLFERFYRGDITHSDTVEGSGLGLSLARAIVAEHRGTIQAQSLPQKSDVALISFVVSLPAA
ncbi:MAG: hypothetical protein LBC35_00080 [Coriobacteriales bacterium]|jgi:signal transduction histidine kinase|nr:hypothetical protein [Coriobacteriales bacterium]